MPARAYRDPTLDTVVHNMTCEAINCPRCTKAPARPRRAGREEIVRSGMATLAAIIRQRRALAAEASSSEEEAGLQSGLSVIKSTED